MGKRKKYAYTPSYYPSVTSDIGRIKEDGYEITWGSCSTVTARPLIALKQEADADVVMPVNDYSVEPLENFKAASIAAIRLLTKEKRVAVCCQGGCGRSGTLVSLVMMAFFGYSARNAVETVVKKRGCGPEADEQYLLLAVAESLRRKGLSGEELVRSLEVPKLQLEKVELTNASRVAIDDVEVDASYLGLLSDVIVEKLRSARKVRVPVDRDIIEKVADLVRNAGREDIAKELAELVDRLEIVETARELKNIVEIASVTAVEPFRSRDLGGDDIEVDKDIKGIGDVDENADDEELRMYRYGYGYYDYDYL